MCVGVNSLSKIYYGVLGVDTYFVREGLSASTRARDDKTVGVEGEITSLRSRTVFI